eukprot:jgi/Mesvir1/4723/Mv11591-RA.2
MHRARRTRKQAQTITNVRRAPSSGANKTSPEDLVAFPRSAVRTAAKGRQWLLSDSSDSEGKRAGGEGPQRLGTADSKIGSNPLCRQLFLANTAGEESARVVTVCGKTPNAEPIRELGVDKAASSNESSPLAVFPSSVARKNRKGKTYFLLDDPVASDSSPENRGPAEQHGNKSPLLGPSTQVSPRQVIPATGSALGAASSPSPRSQVISLAGGVRESGRRDITASAHETPEATNPLFRIGDNAADLASPCVLPPCQTDLDESVASCDAVGESPGSHSPAPPPQRTPQGGQSHQPGPVRQKQLQPCVTSHEEPSQRGRKQHCITTRLQRIDQNASGSKGRGTAGDNGGINNGGGENHATTTTYHHNIDAHDISPMLSSSTPNLRLAGVRPRHAPAGAPSSRKTPAAGRHVSQARASPRVPTTAAQDAFDVPPTTTPPTKTPPATALPTTTPTTGLTPFADSSGNHGGIGGKEVNFDRSHSRLQELPACSPGTCAHPGMPVSAAKPLLAPNFTPTPRGVGSARKGHGRGARTPTTPLRGHDDGDGDGAFTANAGTRSGLRVRGGHWAGQPDGSCWGVLDAAQAMMLASATKAAAPGTQAPMGMATPSRIDAATPSVAAWSQSVTPSALACTQAAMRDVGAACVQAATPSALAYPAAGNRTRAHDREGSAVLAQTRKESDALPAVAATFPVSRAADGDATGDGNSGIRHATPVPSSLPERGGQSPMSPAVLAAGAVPPLFEEPFSASPIHLAESTRPVPPGPSAPSTPRFGAGPATTRGTWQAADGLAPAGGSITMDAPSPSIRMGDGDLSAVGDAPTPTSFGLPALPATSVEATSLQDTFHTADSGGPGGPGGSGGPASGEEGGGSGEDDSVCLLSHSHGGVSTRAKTDGRGPWSIHKDEEFLSSPLAPTVPPALPVSPHQGAARHKGREGHHEGELVTSASLRHERSPGQPRAPASVDSGGGVPCDGMSPSFAASAQDVGDAAVDNDALSLHRCHMRVERHPDHHATRAQVGPQGRQVAAPVVVVPAGTVGYASAPCVPGLGDDAYLGICAAGLRSVDGSYLDDDGHAASSAGKPASSSAGIRTVSLMEPAREGDTPANVSGQSRASSAAAGLGTPKTWALSVAGGPLDAPASPPAVLVETPHHLVTWGAARGLRDGPQGGGNGGDCPGGDGDDSEDDGGGGVFVASAARSRPGRRRHRRCVLEDSDSDGSGSEHAVAGVDVGPVGPAKHPTGHVGEIGVGRAGEGYESDGDKDEVVVILLDEEEEEEEGGDVDGSDGDSAGVVVIDEYTPPWDEPRTPVAKGTAARRRQWVPPACPATEPPRRKGAWGDRDRLPTGDAPPQRKPLSPYNANIPLPRGTVEWALDRSPTPGGKPKGTPTPAKGEGVKGAAAIARAAAVRGVDACVSGAAFQRQKEALTTAIYAEVNAAVFGGRLPGALEIGWSPHLTRTAGITNYKQQACKGVPPLHIASISLSTKVLDDSDKLRQTLCHEMCHVAAWLLDRSAKPPHGKVFKKWASMVQARYPDVQVTTCHSYKVRGALVNAWI